MINRSVRRNRYLILTRLGRKRQNIVNHHPAHDCRGYRFASIFVADIKGQMRRACPKPDNNVSNRIFVA